MDEPDLTVHYFTYQEDNREAHPASQELLDRAEALVSSLRAETKWRSPKRHDHAVFHMTGIGWRFSEQLPPTPPSTSKANVTSLKEWSESAAPDEDDAWSLDHLEEFDHSALHGLFDAARPSSLASRSDLQASIDSLSTPIERAHDDYEKHIFTRSRHADDPEVRVLPPTKRPRLEERSLRSIIPMPHFYGSPMTPNYRWPSFERADAFKTTVTPVPPHSSETVEERLKDVFCRLAWIIPVRGHPPWQTATPAWIVYTPAAESCQAYGFSRQSSHESRSPPSIAWTADALRQFWDLLKGLRDAGNLGPLSIAFHSPSSSAATDPASLRSCVGSHKRETESEISSQSRFSPAPTGVQEPPRTTLSEYAHFKVYHDGRYSKALRNILHSWAYQMDGRKIRLLKGAILALVDDRGKGLLLC
ncbi:hypothetical protein BD414DRAFT_414006 [Trametes punicea]|nr:hypothetical protein BD414DRAFT_414006 [Trametes punicea]